MGVTARYFILTADCFVLEDSGIKKLHIKSSKGLKKIKVEKGKDKDGKDITTYEDLPELTSIEALQALADADGITLVDVDPLIGRLDTFGQVGKFTSDAIEYTIVKTSIPGKLLTDIHTALNCDPLTLEAVTQLGIDHLYGGSSVEELCAIIQARFGIDLSGSYDSGSVDEDGNPIMMPHLIPTTILGEEVV